MGRIARVVAVGVPHHVTQRGNQHQDVFFGDRDRAMYLEILRDYATRLHLRMLAYCVMANHVHLVAIPDEPDALARTLGRTHGDYARWLHVRQRTTGHLWQNRYYSCPLGERHLWAAMRYVESNPVRAQLAEHAWDWEFSSARAHVSGQDERGLLDMAWWNSRYAAADWREALAVGGREDALAARLREATSTGRPLGDDDFCKELESRTGRRLRPGKRGRPAQGAALTGQMVIA